MKTFKRILLLAAAIVIVGYIGSMVVALAGMKKKISFVPVAYAAGYQEISTGTVFEAVNLERASSTIGILSRSPELELAAELKLEDMIANNYFAHVSPSGTTPWSFFKTAGYEFVNAGENLAGPVKNPYGRIAGYFRTTSDLVSAWMNSPDHRANILNERYTETGIAVSHEYKIVVQLFGSVSTSTVIKTDQ